MRLVKLTGDAERATQTSVDTVEITKKLCASWKSPPFQRELRATKKVLELAEEVTKTGVLPGVITLGVLEGERYVVDGQHRLHAFLVSEAILVYADVRTHYFKTMAEMADEYVKLNSSLVRLRPDDILKGLEQSNPNLALVRRKCGFVGYDAVRRGNNAPVLSMSVVIRVWEGSRTDIPALYRGGATGAAEQMDPTDTEELVAFLNLCFSAWRRDPEYTSLWGSLNLILCAWLYRRVVIGDAGRGTSRARKLDPDQFRRCLLSLSAEKDYMEYLVGRRVSERDRAPTYNRLKSIFARRYFDDKKNKLLLPGPAWAHGGK